MMFASEGLACDRLRNPRSWINGAAKILGTHLSMTTGECRTILSTYTMLQYHDQASIDNSIWIVAHRSQLWEKTPWIIQFTYQITTCILAVAYVRRAAHLL